jgi:hypothetical protein
MYPKIGNASMPDAKTLNTIRAAFMRRASAPDINSLALKLAYVIAFKYLNSETGTARPSQDTLARDLNISTRTIRTLLDILQPLGLVVVPGHGPNRAATYWIDPDKATPVSPMGTEKRKPTSGYKRKPASGSKPNTGNLAHDNRKLDDTNSGSQLPPNLTKRTKKKNQGKKSQTQPPHFAAPDLEADAGAKPGNFFDTKKIGIQEVAGRTAAPKASASSNLRDEKNDTKVGTDPAADQADDQAGGESVASLKPDDLAALFAEFFAAYPKHVGEKQARKEFIAAVESGINPALMIGGAKRHAIARAGEPSKYTKDPANWIKGEHWNDELPGTGPPLLDESGNEIIEPPSPRPSRPQSIEEAADIVRAQYPGNKWD